MKISREADEKLKAVLYSIDQNGQPITASSATEQGGTLKLTIAAIGGSYEGKINPDGASITGNFTQNGPAVPLNLVRATPSTAWAIPDPPPPPKAMAANSDPSFEVATIKPSDPNARGQSIQVGRGGGNMFTTTNTTVADLITFAYGVHAKQVTGGPAWYDSEKYDVTAKPDQPGAPNVAQLRTMVKKLLTERFQLAFHREEKELSAYLLTVAKGGLKIAKVTENRGNLPGFGGRGPGNVAIRNSTMAEFAEFLQSRILERPVVDRTALTDRFDFALLWTPDQPPPNAGGGAAPAAPVAIAADAPPDLFGAMQQLGLKIESGKAPVEVLVVDKLLKPSEN
jgi:uncharacterized protein (TIGR03435 family)